MKKIATLCLAALGGLVLTLGIAPAASAYPEQTCNVTVDRQVVDPGDTFTVTGRWESTNASWTFRWNGVTKHRTGAEVHASFTAPEVATSRTITLKARATSPTGSTCIHDLDITVGTAIVAGPTGGGGLLPNTGGPTFWLLVAAIVLLLGGGGALLASRRRN